jgi:hypothetical protein
VNIILKAIINFIKDIIGKLAYKKQISTLVEKQQKLEKEIVNSKSKANDLKQKLKEIPKEKNAKDAADFVKNFINKGRK